MYDCEHSGDGTRNCAQVTRVANCGSVSKWYKDFNADVATNEKYCYHHTKELKEACFKGIATDRKE